MIRHYRQAFMAATFLLAGLEGFGASHALGGEPEHVGKSPLLEACKTAPEYKRSSISYSKTAKRDASIRWSRKTWLQLFPKRFVYSIPTLEIMLYERDSKVPAGFDPEEETAFVLGRLSMPIESGCGLLVLEDGYYSSTRIVLYPVLSNGTAGAGLELADQFADEGEKIVVSSTLFSTGQRIRIATKLTRSVLNKPNTNSTRMTPQDFRHLWEFERASGFVEQRQKTH